MIKPEELRLGNWVHHKDQWSYRQSDQDFKEFDFQWDDRDWYAIGECTMNFEDVSPILLTEEWLLKVGFETSGWLGRWQLQIENNGLIVCSDDFNEWWVYSGLGDSDSYGFQGAHLKYVHQLQNLYFALTNKELTIKP